MWLTALDNQCGIDCQLNVFHKKTVTGTVGVKNIIRQRDLDTHGWKVQCYFSRSPRRGESAEKELVLFRFLAIPHPWASPLQFYWSKLKGLSIKPSTCCRKYVSPSFWRLNFRSWEVSWLCTRISPENAIWVSRAFQKEVHDNCIIRKNYWRTSSTSITRIRKNLIYVRSDSLFWRPTDVQEMEMYKKENIWEALVISKYATGFKRKVEVVSFFPVPCSSSASFILQ